MADKDNVMKNVVAASCYTSAAFEINGVSSSSFAVPVPADETMPMLSTSATVKTMPVQSKACVAGLPQADAKSLVSVCFLKGRKESRKESVK